MAFLEGMNQPGGGSGENNGPAKLRRQNPERNKKPTWEFGKHLLDANARLPFRDALAEAAIKVGAWKGGRKLFKAIAPLESKWAGATFDSIPVHEKKEALQQSLERMIGMGLFGELSKLVESGTLNFPLSRFFAYSEIRMLIYGLLEKALGRPPTQEDCSQNLVSLLPAYMKISKERHKGQPKPKAWAARKHEHGKKERKKEQKDRFMRLLRETGGPLPKRVARAGVLSELYSIRLSQETLDALGLQGEDRALAALGISQSQSLIREFAKKAAEGNQEDALVRLCRSGDLVLHLKSIFQLYRKDSFEIYSLLQKACGGKAPSEKDCRDNCLADMAGHVGSFEKTRRKQRGGATQAGGRPDADREARKKALEDMGEIASEVEEALSSHGYGGALGAGRAQQKAGTQEGRAIARAPLINPFEKKPSCQENALDEDDEPEPLAAPRGDAARKARERVVEIALRASNMQLSDEEFKLVRQANKDSTVLISDDWHELDRLRGAGLRHLKQIDWLSVGEAHFQGEKDASMLRDFYGGSFKLAINDAHPGTYPDER